MQKKYLHITALFLDHDINIKQMFCLHWTAFSATVMQPPNLQFLF